MSSSLSSAAPRPPTDDRPPIGAVPSLSAAEPFRRLRPTVHDRPLVCPEVWQHDEGGVAVIDPYVRRYWTPVLGPGAVADLLRLATAAERHRSLPRPVYLSTLVRAGMVAVDAGRLRVKTHVPELPKRFHHQLPPRLRRELLERSRKPCVS